jgi:general secretion pathway protein F/type IV pilus assembly protein PilC
LKNSDLKNSDLKNSDLKIQICKLRFEISNFKFQNRSSPSKTIAKTITGKDTSNLMPEFTYKARNLAGEIVSGSMDANSERDVVSALTGKSLFPVKVETGQKSKAVTFGGRVNAQKIAVFYEQLSSLMSNGVPMMRSLRILKEQTRIPVFENALEDVISRVEDGETLSDAFARHPKIFSDMAVNMSRAGAEGGFLEDALQRVAAFTEQQDELRSRTVGALIYPAVLATIGSIVVAVLIVFFVPKFGQMFDQLRAVGELPAITEWLLGFSNFVRSYGLILVIVAAVLFMLLRVQLNTERGKMLVDRIKLKLPIIGPVFLSLAVGRFCRVLGTLLRNGVPILKALDISRDASGNKVLSNAIADASENITSGESLSGPLGKSGHFPRNVTEMISVAEESNTLDDVLINISEGLEKQTIRRLDLMVKLIEPLMLMIMAGIILVVVVALLLPIMKMGNAMQ